MFAQQSFLWLFGQELRVMWRHSLLVRTRAYVIIPAALVALVFQLAAILLAALIAKHPLPLPQMLLVANMNLIILGVLMLSRAMTAAVEVLYARGDVDFLLASPIPPGRVLAVRMIGVALGVSAPWLLLGGTLANGLLVFGQGWALAIYPMLLAEAFVAAALAFVLVVLLVRWLGARVARRAGHGLALAMGVVIFALGQAPRFVSEDQLGRFWASLLPAGVPHGVQFMPGLALLGAPAPLLACLAASALLFCAVWAMLSQRFADGILTASAYRQGAPAKPDEAPYPAGPLRAQFRKHLYLLSRFPGVVSQTVYRSLTLVPVILILAGNLHGEGGIAVAAPLVVFLAGQLAVFFLSVILGTDDAPDLTATAPVTAGQTQRTAYAAAAYAVILIMMIPIAGIYFRAAALIPPVLAGIVLVVVSNLVIGYRMPIPLIRADFGKARNGSLVGLVLGVAVSSLWSVVVWCAVTPHPMAWLLQNGKF